MSQTYLLSSQKTQITTTNNSLSIKTLKYEKISRSLFHRIRYFLVKFMSVFLLLAVASAIAYFALHSITIGCERKSADTDVICSVTKNYHIVRPNEIILSSEAIKEINVSKEFTAGEAFCRLEMTTTNNLEILPLGSTFSTGQCDLSSTLEPIRKLFINNLDSTPIQLGFEKITLTNSLYPWLGFLVLSLFAISKFLKIIFQGLLIKTSFDRNKQTITRHYLSLFRNYKKEYSFDEIRKIVINNKIDSKSGKIKTAENPYLLLRDFKRAEIEVYGKVEEKFEVAEQIKKILAS